MTVDLTRPGFLHAAHCAALGVAVAMTAARGNADTRFSPSPRVDDPAVAMYSGLAQRTMPASRVRLSVVIHVAPSDDAERAGRAAVRRAFAAAGFADVRSESAAVALLPSGAHARAVAASGFLATGSSAVLRAGAVHIASDLRSVALDAPHFGASYFADDCDAREDDLIRRAAADALGRARNAPHVEGSRLREIALTSVSPPECTPEGGVGFVTVDPHAAMENADPLFSANVRLTYTRAGAAMGQPTLVVYAHATLLVPADVAHFALRLPMQSDPAVSARVRTALARSGVAVAPVTPPEADGPAPPGSVMTAAGTLAHPTRAAIARVIAATREALGPRADAMGAMFTVTPTVDDCSAAERRAQSDATARGTRLARTLAAATGRVVRTATIEDATFPNAFACDPRMRSLTTGGLALSGDVGEPVVRIDASERLRFTTQTR
jgi:hypothetical protein